MADNDTGTDREFTRIEAAAFLTEIGRKMSPQRLAKKVTEGMGPPFTKNGRSVIYKESELRTWAASPDSNAKGGRGKRVTRNAPVNMIAPGMSKRLPAELVSILREHVILAERFADGTADGITGYQFARSLATLRRLVS